MPFHLRHSSTTKYSSYEDQKIHECEYKKFLQTLPATNRMNLSEPKRVNKHGRAYHNNNYLYQRQMNLQSREDRRKIEYERIQKENLKFSQRLIHAKAFLNRSDQQISFDKHCQLKQRLQRYPNASGIKRTKAECPEISHRQSDTSFLIYNDNDLSLKSMKQRGKQSTMKNQVITTKNLLCNINKSAITQKKLPHFIKHNVQLSETLPSIIATTNNIDLSKQIPAVSNTNDDPSIHILKLNISTNTEHLQHA